MDQKSQRALSWPLKGLLMVLALLAGFFDQPLGGWGRAFVIAAAGIAVPALLFRRFWSLSRFWLTAALAAAAQVPVIVAVTHLTTEPSSLYMLLSMLIDCLFVIALFSLACRKADQERS